MNIVLEIWNSFRSMPAWVQIWVAFILAPVNMASLLFLNEVYGLWIALLAIGGMTPNLVIMAYERGLSKAMALPHLVIWTPLVIIIALWLNDGGPDAQLFPMYLWVLLGVNLISLAFDLKDGLAWLGGDRDIAH